MPRFPKLRRSTNASDAWARIRLDHGGLGQQKRQLSRAFRRRISAIVRCRRPERLRSVGATDPSTHRKRSVAVYFRACSVDTSAPITEQAKSNGHVPLPLTCPLTLRSVSGRRGELLGAGLGRSRNHAGGLCFSGASDGARVGRADLRRGDPSDCSQSIRYTTRRGDQRTGLPCCNSCRAMQLGAAASAAAAPASERLSAA
jgi:hypothetical protein